MSTPKPFRAALLRSTSVPPLLLTPLPASERGLVDAVPMLTTLSAVGQQIARR